MCYAVVWQHVTGMVCVCVCAVRCVECVALNTVVWQHVIGMVCVLCAVLSELH